MRTAWIHPLDSPAEAAARVAEDPRLLRLVVEEAVAAAAAAAREAERADVIATMRHWFDDDEEAPPREAVRVLRAVAEFIEEGGHVGYAENTPPGR